MSDPVPVPSPVLGDEDYRDHVAEMLARLPEQFKAKQSSNIINNISLLLMAFGDSAQSLEGAGQQVLTQRTLENSIGVQLDNIGEIVGQARNGLDDDTYRRYCRAAIVAHRSNGTVEDIIRVVSLVIFNPLAYYDIAQLDIATVDVRILNIPLTDDLAAILLSFLKRIAASGVRIVTTYGTSDPATWFRFNSGPGFNSGHLVGRIE